MGKLANLPEEGSAPQKALRAKLAIGAIVLLLVNLAVGLFAREQQHSIINYAINIYDTAFTSTNYIHRAQISFQRFVDERLRANSPAEIAAIDEQRRKVLDELDVAIERSVSQKDRAQGFEVREQIENIESDPIHIDPLGTRLARIQIGLDRLGQRASSVVLKARDEIDDFSSRGDLLLLGSIITSTTLAGLALALLRHVITQSTIAKITHMATYDALTGLPNRRLLHAHAAAAIEAQKSSGRSLALLSLDLDRFKNVNDTLGHHMGDLLLIEVAKRIAGVIRESDIVARFGGDEFVVMLTAIKHSSEAGHLAERIIHTLCAPYLIDGQRILVGASIGIAIAPTDGLQVEELLRNSDVALYRAKAEGKGRFMFFTSEMNNIAQLRRVLELDLREALEKGALDVHFQPLIDLTTKHITAFESLVRWNHPIRGAIPPQDFVPLAEETGLIVQLGEYVLRVACREAAAWAQPVRVAVNLSAAQFRSGNLTALTAAVLRETGLAPDRLEFEITESILMDDTEGVMATLMALRNLGVRIALDDFGTGYSSLAYLSSFPFDKIKIDRSFVHDVEKRPDAAAIIRAILSLAATLNMATTAEGIEKDEELEWLRSHGCREGQGYLFSKAVSTDVIHALLENSRDLQHQRTTQAAA